VTEHDVHPGDLGLPVSTIEDLRGGSPDDNALTLRSVLAGDGGPVRDLVLLNAAAGLVAWDLLQDPSQAERPIVKRLAARLETAARTVDGGAAATKLEEWIAATRAA
jgi:anthranilate phosphoribosyltransferase